MTINVRCYTFCLPIVKPVLNIDQTIKFTPIHQFQPIDRLFPSPMLNNVFGSDLLQQADIHEHLQQRRSSYNIEYGRNRSGGSASKVDLLKSALEINHKTSHTSVSSRTDRTSNQSLNRYRADSAPKLNLTTPKSLLIPSDPVLEVIK